MNLCSNVCICLLLLSLSIVPTARCEERIFYPRPEHLQDSRNDYIVELLRRALERSSGDYRLLPSTEVIPQQRAISNLQRDQGLDVFWTMTSAERERNLQPVRVPIQKGMVGWRIPLIVKRNRGMFNSVYSREQLQALSAGQGHDWPDLRILRENGYTTIGSPSYLGLFKLLAAGRVDYFPRSILEIWNEAKFHADKGIVVDSKFMLIYPAAMYYFVSRENTALYEAIREGLEAMIVDGEMDRLLFRYYGGDLEKAKVDSRTVFYLENPALPPQTPLNRKELWMTPKRYQALAELWEKEAYD